MQKTAFHVLKWSMFQESAPFTVIKVLLKKLTIFNLRYIAVHAVAKTNSDIECYFVVLMTAEYMCLQALT